MPSDLISASPRMTAFAVVSGVTFAAGSAKRLSRARSRIAQYVLKSGTGIMVRLARSGFDLPNAFTVIADGAVRRKFSHSRRIEDGRTRPRLRVAPQPVHPVLCVDVSLIIREKQKWIVIEKVLHNWTEQVTISARKLAAGDEVYYVAEHGILLVVLAWMIAARFHHLHLLCSERKSTRLNS